MEERDLSVLSVRKLMQMLDATLLRLQKHKAESQMHKLDTKDALEGSRRVEKEKKSKIQVEAKYIAVDEDAKEAKETEMKEKIEDEIDEVEEKENAATGKRLKLQPFSSKENFGDNPKEKVKAEAFQLEDTADIWPTYVTREAASKGMRRGWDAERVWAQRWEYDKRKKWEKAEASDGKEEKQDCVVNWVKQIKWRWGRSLKLNKTKKEIEEQGFRVNVTQHSRTGPKSFSAQSYYRQVRPVDEGSKGVVSVITTSKSLTKTKTHRNTSSSSSSAFVSDILKKIDATTLKTKPINKPAMLSYSFNDDTTRSNEFKVAFFNGWVLGSRDVSQVPSPFISGGSHGEIFRFAKIFKETYWRDHQPKRISLGAIVAVAKPSTFFPLTDVEIVKQRETEEGMTLYLHKLDEDCWKRATQATQGSATVLESQNQTPLKSFLVENSTSHLEDKVKLLGEGNERTLIQ